DELDLSETDRVLRVRLSRLHRSVRTDRDRCRIGRHDYLRRQGIAVLIDERAIGAHMNGTVTGICVGPVGQDDLEESLPVDREIVRLVRLLNRADGENLVREGD